MTNSMYMYSMFRSCGCLEAVHVCGLEAMEGSNSELKVGRRELGRGEKEANMCGHTHMHNTHPHSTSSDHKGHLVWSGSVTASAQSS